MQVKPSSQPLTPPALKITPVHIYCEILANHSKRLEKDGQPHGKQSHTPPTMLLDSSYHYHSYKKRQVLAKAYAAAAGDLSAISAISGCVSVGPPSSVPALISLSTHLKEAADAVSDEEISSGSECKDSVALSRLLKVASVSIGDLAKEYD